MGRRRTHIIPVDERERVKLSKYTHCFQREGFTAFFHSLNMNKVYGDQSLLKIYERLRKCGPKGTYVKADVDRDAVRTLRNLGFVIPSSHDEKGDLEALRSRTGGFNIRNIVMLVSNNCNFRCSYCQIEENMKREHMIDMPVKVADRALDLFFMNSNPKEKKTVTITGGEPLLNMESVRHIVEVVRGTFKNTRIVVFTNGSLVTEELARYFKAHDVLMLISLDGTREMHDQVRKFKGGKGTFEAALRGYRHLREAGCNVGISAVGGTHNVDKADEFFDFLVSLSPPSIGYNFSHFLIDKENPTEIPIAFFGKKLVRFYEILRQKGIFLENISRPISAFASSTPRMHECQAQGFGFTVDARGMIGPCKSLVVSDVFAVSMDGVERIEENGMFREWSTRSPLLEEACEPCPALTICGGGCAYDSYVANKGEYGKIDRRVCDYHLDMLEYLIWDLFEHCRSRVLLAGLYAPSNQEQIDAFTRYYDANNELQKSVGHEAAD